MMRSFGIAALALALGACASDSGGGTQDAHAALAGTSWTIVEILGEVVPSDERRPAELVFLEEARFAGSAGCNRVLGGALQDGANLRLTPGPMTKMACPEPVATREAAFLEALGLVTEHRRTGDALELLGGERVVLRLAPKPGAPD
jgi:heat shock protein HslJ